MRIIVYDRTQSWLAPDKKNGWLALSWLVGAWIFKLLGRADKIIGIVSWHDFFEQLKKHDGIKRIEYFGHGHMGGVTCSGSRMDDGRRLSELRDSMAPGAILWWRTCSTFSDRRGKKFAEDCARALGCRVAGHTFIIWLWQAGLHVLSPNEVPTWSDGEGRKKDERGNLWSWPWSPNSIFMFRKGPQ